MIVLPPAPRCVLCEHEACPCCRDWCDVLVPMADPDPEWPHEREPCACDGRCQYEPADAPELWEQQWPEAWAAICSGVTIVVAEGPFWPGPR